MCIVDYPREKMRQKMLNDSGKDEKKMCPDNNKGRL